MLVDFLLIATGATSFVVAALGPSCTGKKLRLTPGERLPPFLGRFGTAPEKAKSNNNVHRSSLHSAAPRVAMLLRGGAVNPRYPEEASENSRRDGLGGDDDDSEAIDLEALLQSVTADGENVSIDLQELAELGDFSGLGRLDFSHGKEEVNRVLRSRNGITSESNQGGDRHRPRGRVGPQQEEEEEEFDGMGWDENPRDCGMWNTVGEVEEKGEGLDADVSDEVGNDEEYWEDDGGDDSDEVGVENGIVERGMRSGIWEDELEGVGEDLKGVEKEDAFEEDWESEEGEEGVGEVDDREEHEESDGLDVEEGDYVEDANGDGGGIIQVGEEKIGREEEKGEVVRNLEDYKEKTEGGGMVEEEEEECVVDGIEDFGAGEIVNEKYQDGRKQSEGIGEEVEEETVDDDIDDEHDYDEEEESDYGGDGEESENEIFEAGGQEDAGEGRTIRKGWQRIGRDEEYDDEEEEVDDEGGCRGEDDEDREEEGKLKKGFDDARHARPRPSREDSTSSGESSGEWMTDGEDCKVDSSPAEGIFVDDVSCDDEDDEILSARVDGDQIAGYGEEETDVETEAEDCISFASSKGNTGSSNEMSEREADDQPDERSRSSYKNSSTNVAQASEKAPTEKVGKRWKTRRYDISRSVTSVSDSDGEQETPEHSPVTEASQANEEESRDKASEESVVGMEEWLDFQRRDPVPSDVPPRKTFDQLLEDGLAESDDEHEAEEIARKIGEHRELGRRWVSGVTSSSGLRRTRKQIMKVMLLQATSNVISGGGAPGTSPGRERLALAGVVIGCGTTVVHRRLRRRIEGADFGNAADVETKARSPLAALLRKEAYIRRVSVKEHDLACLRSAARWGIILFVIGAVLSMVCRAGEPLFICAALGLSRYFAEPIFFVHAMGRGGGAAGARRPFTPPSILNSLLGSPHGLLSVDETKEMHG